MIFSVLIFVALAVVYYLLKKNYNYWNEKGVPGPKPSYIVGNIGQCFFFKKTIGDIITDLYSQYSYSPMVGIFRGTSPLLIVRDPDIIKDITIKSFGNFHDNDVDVEPEVDPLMGRDPFFLNGKHWKTVRSKITPCFTSGRMKSLFPILGDSGERLVKFVEKELKQNNLKDHELLLEAKELCTRFTLNNVAGCAFGLDGKCFEDPNSEILKIGKQFLIPSGWSSVMFVFAFLIPSISKALKIRLVKKTLANKFLSIVEETLRYRSKNGFEGSDILQTISQLKTTCNEYRFTDLDATAACFGFFMNGYENCSLVMSFMLYELAKHPQIQTKLRTEIKEAFSINDGTLKCETLSSLSYLDGVYKESLRLHPMIQFMVRRCTKSFTYNPKSGDGIDKPIIIDEGTSVALPAGGLHTDPKYYKNPQKFVPDRFLGENKHSITKCTYLPFGEGPRACLGERFATLQIKTGIAYIIKNFELKVNPKTQTPFKYDPYHFLLSPIGGIWLDFKKV